MKFAPMVKAQKVISSNYSCLWLVFFVFAISLCFLYTSSYSSIIHKTAETSVPPKTFSSLVSTSLTFDTLFNKYAWRTIDEELEENEENKKKRSLPPLMSAYLFYSYYFRKTQIHYSISQNIISASNHPAPLYIKHCTYLI